MRILAAVVLVGTSAFAIEDELVETEVAAPDSVEAARP